MALRRHNLKGGQLFDADWSTVQRTLTMLNWLTPLQLLANLEDQDIENTDFFELDGGGGWIRTNVGLANGFTVRPL